MPEPLEEIQDRILDRLHAGEVPDRDALLAAHPEHAEPLARFLDLLEELESAPPPASREPARLGEFRILRELGRGGMGIVYEAEQASLKRRVALKVLPPALGRDPRVVVRFRREAEAAGRLRHPNVVPVYSVGEAAGTPFFAMELVEGRSLADAVRERGAGRDGGPAAAAEPWRRWAVETVARIADALHYAHGQGILHRDVKPGNILLEKDGTPRLTDFGLAMDLAAPGLTATGETFGTPLYMSPEQALRREAPLDPRTDVYSLGVTLYEALTLHTPYEGTSTPEILTALHQGRIVAPRSKDPGMPEPLERIVLQALRKDPADRYATAGAFAEDLRNWLASRPVEAAPPPPPPVAVPVPEPAESRFGNVVWYVVWGFSAIGFPILAAFDLLPHPWRKDSAPENSAPEDSSDSAALDSEGRRLLAEGRHPRGEAALADWLRPRVRMRSVVARSSLGDYECGIAPGALGELGKDRFRVAILGRFEASVDRGPWKEIPGSTFLTISGGSTGTMNVTPSIEAVLGDALKKGSVNLRHRARIRIVPWSDDVTSIPPIAKDGIDPVAAAWNRPGGTSCTWEDERTLVVYDDYPEGYPELVSGPSVDGEMLASMTPTGYEGGRGSPEENVGITLQGLGETGPLALACEVDLLHPKSGEVLGTTTLDREDRGPAYVPNPNIRRGMGLSFPVPAIPVEGREEFVRDLLAGRARSVSLRFRPSRRLALEKTVYERIWGQTFELVVPAEGSAPGKRAEARIVPAAAEMGVSVSMSGDEPEKFTRSALARLAAGKPRRGDPTIVQWAQVWASVPSKYSMKEGFGPRYGYACGVDLRSAKSAESGEPSEDVLVLALWERALGSGPWVELGFTATTLSEGRGNLYATMDEIREAYRPGTTAPVRHRVKVRLLPRPEGWRELREKLAEAWKLPFAASCTHSQANVVDVVEEYPADFPTVLAPGKAEVDEAMARAVTPSAVELNGMQSDDTSYWLNGFLQDSPGGGFAPAAFEVDLYVGGDAVPLGTGEATFDRQEPGTDPTPSSRGVAFVAPKTEKSERRFTDATTRMKSGELKEVRLVFRPSRRVAIEKTDCERYWGGTVDVVVPVRAK